MTLGSRVSVVLTTLGTAALGAAACASGGAGVLGPPTLTGQYELIGPFTREDTEAGPPIIVTFLPNRMVQYRRALDVGPPEPPRRYLISGDRVTFNAAGVEIRVRRGAQGGLEARAFSTYYEQGRSRTVCVMWSPIDDRGRRSCVREETLYEQVERRYDRPVTFRRTGAE